MSAPFAARRKARVVGPGADEADDREPEESLVKRPGPIKSKKRSAARISFGGGTSMTEDDENAPIAVITPKAKGSLGRKALEKSALRRAQLPEVAAVRRPEQEERPTYSKAYLDELRNATPSTPQGESSTDEIDVAAKFGPQPGTAIDVAAKFGTDLARYESSAAAVIPTDAEIQEKKARRARLAAEQRARGSRSGSSSDDDDERPEAAPAADDSDDEFRAQHDTISLRPAGSTLKKRAETTRLVPQDEDVDFMEDDAAYPSRGTIPMSRSAQRAEQHAERQQIRSRIDAAEGSGSDTSDSERAARDAYEAAQTRRGMDRGPALAAASDDGSRVPTLTPLPNLRAVVDSLRARLQRLRQEEAADVRRLEEVARERDALADQERGVERVLAEIQERWRALVRDGVLAGGDEGGMLEGEDRKLLEGLEGG